MESDDILVEIEKISPQDGDIILLKLNTRAARFSIKQLEIIMQWLAEKDPCKGKLILAIDSTLTLESVPEETMNKYGWFKGYKEHD